ncbi:MAG: hypothetical protein D6801_07765 [Alphaproteobacteria bacterium]|nr:MAG: hypothetical protein D6801_07765 [Alphaproteobacteria bacterium]
MSSRDEKQKIVDFVTEQCARAGAPRRWRRRLAAFGFTIEKTENGPMIALLPKRKIVCPFPTERFA